MHTSAYLRVQRKSRSGRLRPSHPIGILAASNHLAYVVGTAKKIKKGKCTCIRMALAACTTRSTGKRSGRFTLVTAQRAQQQQAPLHQYIRRTLKFNTTSRSQLGRGEPALLIIGLPSSREPQERSLVCDKS